MHKLSNAELPGQTQINAEGFIVRAHIPHPTRSAISRFFKKIEVKRESALVDDPCWRWLGCRSRNGYGQFKVDARRGFTRKTGPHVFAYEYFIGAIPEGAEVHHKCYNRACCNPLHLEIVTHRENMLDENAATRAAMNARKTHCLRGHEYTPENTYTHRKGRQCRACLRERQKAFRVKNPGAQARYRSRAT